MKRRIFATLLAFLMIISLCSCGGAIKSSDAESRIVGECGGRDVRYEELRYIVLTCKEKYLNEYGEDAFLGEEIREDFLEEVFEQIEENYAGLIIFEKNGIKLSDKEIRKGVEEYVKYIKDVLGGEDAYVEYLKECNMTDWVCRFTNGLEIAFEKYYEVVAVSCEKEAYDAVMSKDGFIRTLSIFIKNDEGERVSDNRAAAEKVLSEIKGGTPFESFIGSKYNQDLGACDYYFMKGYFDEEYEEAAFDLDIGEVSDVVEVDGGFYIIKRMPLEDGYFLDNLSMLQNMYIVCKTYENISELADELDFELNAYGKTLDIFNMQ